MTCPACQRPVAVARARCVYCGAPLPSETMEEASLAARRVLEARSLVGLEEAAAGPRHERGKRNYLILDTQAASPEVIAESCVVSIWEARLWRAGPRYRLMRVIEASVPGQAQSAGPHLFSLPEAVVEPLRNPIPVESIKALVDPSPCALRDHEDEPPRRKELRRDDVALIISGAIKREKVREPSPKKARADGRMEEILLVHVHLRSEGRPWEIAPRRTAFEGPGLASAHMRTLTLLRRFAETGRHDEGFRNLVPALSVGTPDGGPLGLASSSKRGGKEPKVVILDNLAQFREYSAWRGAVERRRTEQGPETP